MWKVFPNRQEMWKLWERLVALWACWNRRTCFISWHCPTWALHMWTCCLTSCRGGTLTLLQNLTDNVAHAEQSQAENRSVPGLWQAAGPDEAVSLLTSMKTGGSESCFSVSINAQCCGYALHGEETYRRHFWHFIIRVTRGVAYHAAHNNTGIHFYMIKTDLHSVACTSGHGSFSQADFSWGVYIHNRRMAEGGRDATLFLIPFSPCAVPAS